MKQFTIQENDANQRLDKFLKKLFPRATRGLIYKCNRKGKIKVAKSGEKFKKQDNEYKLQIGDVIKIYLHDDDFATLTKEKKQSVSSGGLFDPKSIVYQDADLFVVNKKPGINVHPGDYKTKESNLIAQVQDYLGEKLNSLTFAPSLIHRIDRDTSGIVLIAKKKPILTKLVADFKTHNQIEKTYYTIVIGRLPKKKGIITAAIKRIENAKNTNKVQIHPSGKTAVTHYTLIKEHQVKTSKETIIISEVEVQIETGRMHQIRVHMAEIGCPIVGDKKYGNISLNTFFENNYELQRQALHAWKLRFFHHGRKKSLQLVARLPDDLVDFIKKIG